MKVSTGKIHTIMKTKNIFLTAISALFIFAACTEEKIIKIKPGVVVSHSRILLIFSPN